MEKLLTIALSNMALHLLILENEERRCLMAERLLEDPEDVLHFDDKTLINDYRLIKITT